MKRVSRFIAILLAAVMLVQILPISASAKGGDGKFHYVSIGDSTTNGYGFDDYYLEGSGKDVRGFLQIVPESYPVKIAEKLEGVYGEGNVVLHQLAGSALRPDDLDAILDPNHVDDDYTKRVFSKSNEEGGIEEWFEIWGQRIDPGVKNCAEGEEVLRAAFCAAIGQADLITYNLGANNFGTFITGALVGERYGDTDTLQDLLATIGITNEQLNVAAIRAQIVGFASQQLSGQIDLAALDAQLGDYIDLFLHGFVSFVYYFTKNIEAIRMINPNCAIVVTALHNYVPYLKANFNGQSIDLSDVYGKVLELANVYMGALSSRADDFYYADLAAASYPVFLDELLQDNLGTTTQGYLDDMVGGIAKGIVPALAQQSSQAVGAMLRGWYEDGFTDSDYPLLAALAESMGLVDQQTAVTLSELGMTLPEALKIAWLYHTGSDDFVPVFDKLLTKFAAADPSMSMMIGIFQGLIKPMGRYTNFAALQGYLGIASMFGITQLTDALSMLDSVGTQLDSIRNYGRVQEILLDCVSTEPFDVASVFAALGGGLDMGAIGAEVAAALATGTELSASTKTLVNLYFMFMFPNGMGICAHPNEAGHNVMADVIYRAYSEKIVAKPYMTNKLFLMAADLTDKIIARAGDVTVPSFSALGLKKEDVHKYVALGDSTVFGYGFEDFDFDSQIFDDTFGYGACSSFAYPALIVDALGLEAADFKQLSMGCIRVEDIRSILDASFGGDGYYEKTIIPLLNEHAGGLDKAREEYISSIESADLITICAGGNNFGTFLGDQMDRIIAGEEQLAMDWSKYAASDLAKINGLVDQVFGMLKELNPNAGSALLEGLAKTFIYAYVGTVENYGAILDQIHQINPDAKIALLGLFNPVDDLYYQYNGTEAKIRLGKLVDILMSTCNQSFRQAAESRSDYCCFVNVEDTQMFTDTDANRASLNFADGEYLSYMDVNHGLASHPDAVGHQYMYHQIMEALGLGNLLHTLKHHEAVPATCVSAGTIEYWECTDSGCLKLFADANATQEIQQADLAVPVSTVHDYGDWEPATARQHKRVCKKDAGHVEFADHEFVGDECVTCHYRKAACVSTKEISLSATGAYEFTLGGKELGLYTFTKNGSSWYIQNEEGKYLTIQDTALAYSEKPFAWTYSNNAFRASVASASSSSAFGWGWGWGGSRSTTYYLVYSNELLGVSTGTTGSRASFGQRIENDEHTFGTWKAAADGKHTRTCSVCKAVETADCVYGKDHACEFCGRIDPDLVYITVQYVTGEDASAAPKSEKVVSKDPVKKPEDPTRIGFIFDGWYAPAALEAFDFAAGSEADVTLTAKWTQCMDHTYEDDYCTKCGARDPEAVIHCVGKVKTSLKEGKLVLTLNNKELGEYTFTKTGENKWTILNKDGKYLSIDNKTLTYSDDAFVWKFSNNSFSAEVSGGTTSTWFWGFSGTSTYYLVYTNGKLSVSTSTTGRAASFAENVDRTEHTFGAWKTADDKSHTRKCEVCGEVETQECHYGEDHICSVCKGFDPDAAKIEVKASVTRKSTASMWVWGISTTTYTATITTKATGTTVSKVEYSTNNGASWKTGTSFTSSSNITAFQIRVTDQNGVMTVYEYSNNEVKAK